MHENPMVNTEKIKVGRLEDMPDSVSKKKENWLETLRSRKLEKISRNRNEAIEDSNVKTPKARKKIKNIERKENLSSSLKKKLSERMKIMKSEKIKENSDIRNIFWKMQEKISDDLDKGQILKKINVKVDSPRMKIQNVREKGNKTRKISPEKQKSVKDLIRKLESKS